MLWVAALCAATLTGAERGRIGVYEVIELAVPSPDPVTFRHSGTETRIYPFDDGGANKVRFCPTSAGRWQIAGTEDYVTATATKRHGFWMADQDSPGRRWYKRSDGSHQYVFGNTMYSFLSERSPEGKPNGSDIVRDVRGNAGYFKKLRFSAIGDLYHDRATGPFLDDTGRPTYDGAWSHRPNSNWFRERVDVAVKTAFDADLIADLILSGVDTETARNALSPAHNNRDPEPFLRYLAARYGAYPNVWMCLINEYDIRRPKYTPSDIQRFGATLRKYLPYSTPVSVHMAERKWPEALNSDPSWNDHVIIQRKLKTVATAADALDAAWRAGGSDKPAIDDELSYEGAGDRHLPLDTLEAHLGAFLGGGYGSTGYKAASKIGQYFTGNFDVKEHTSAESLKWLREVIDRDVTFWQMKPGAEIFSGLDSAFRAMSWEDHEYVLGTDKASTIKANLPAGNWRVTSYDAAASKQRIISKKATGNFEFDVPDSRATLVHFARVR